MFVQQAVVLALSAVALGKVFIIEPVATTSWAAGSPQTISWQDDGTAPTLEAFGPAKISIYVGSQQQQTLLQAITPSLDVSKAGSVEFTPDPKIGPNGKDYFIRFESIGLQDTTATPAAPALSFSSKFAMTGMTGTFTPEIQAQINGASPAAANGTTPAVASGAATNKPNIATPSPIPTNNTPAGATPKTTSASSSASSAGASGTAGANTSKPTGAASTLSHSGFMVVAAAAAAVGVALL